MLKEYCDYALSYFWTGKDKAPEYISHDSTNQNNDTGVPSLISQENQTIINHYENMVDISDVVVSTRVEGSDCHPCDELLDAIIEWDTAASSKTDKFQISVRPDAFATKSKSYDKDLSCMVDALNHPPADKSYTFGILDLSVKQMDIVQTPLAIVFQIDKSGSMDEKCSDTKTKMEHIQHALKNMVRTLAYNIENHPGLTIYLALNVFSHDVVNIVKKSISFPDFNDDFILLTCENAKALCLEIDRITPWGLTNIEKSMKNAQTLMQEFQSKYPECRCVHIQFTDGEATVGKKKPRELVELVDGRYKNVFVGIGEDHDCHLLGNLAERSIIHEYRFIDNMENAGLICGEILYNLLYPAFDQSPLWIDMSRGAWIYNWFTNQWVNSMMIPPLAGKSQKTFHILKETSDDTATTTTYATVRCAKNELIHYDAVVLPELMDRETHEIYRTNLSLYRIRHLTQQLLFMVKQFELQRQNEDDTHSSPERGKDRNRPLKKEMKDRLSKHLALLQEHAATLEKESDIQFIQVLMDDTEVAYRALGTRNGLMYTTARCSSQGHQYSYTPTGKTQLTDAWDDVPHAPKHAQRNITNYTNDMLFSMMTQVQDISGEFNDV